MTDQNDAVATPEEEVEEATPQEQDEQETSEDTGSEEIDWKARALKAEKAIEKAKKKEKTQSKEPITQPGSQETDEIPEWGKKIIQSDEKRQFGYDRQLAPETVDALFKYNGGNAPTAEQLESDDVMKGIVKTLEAKRRVAANIPKGGSSPTYKGKTYAETVTSTDASSEDKQAAFQAAQKKYGIN